ncbi:YmfQ family protein [Pseudomonas resinovorans]|uniref:YmfQ family protein n=1 Tax=Metapseudomonas resinovorans TaxID=53412 RepID=A0ABT4Y404_METRE|nr:putative phage tail protein [Pseudomonas resinovorans]MDA8483582.1 YmfQ family protein [Pseudomonas resinovorans]
MAVFKSPLRAGDRCGSPIVTWVESVSGTLVATAQVRSPQRRLRLLSGDLQADAQVTLQGWRMRPLRGDLAAGARVQGGARRLRREAGALLALAEVALRAQVWLPLQPERSVRHRRYDRAAYQQMLLDLLPRGRAWPRDGEDAALMMAWAGELQRVEERGWKLFEEWDPRTTDELFTDWEAFFELPGTGSSEQRRRELIAEWLAGGSLTREDIDDLLKQLGIDATVEYWRPFIVGQSAVGENLNTDGYSTWIVYVHNPDEVDLDWLETYLRRLAPAGDYVHVVAAPNGVPDGSNL